VNRIRALILLLALFAAGCAAKPVELEGAVHPDQIPIYASARVDRDQSIGGATMEGDEGVFYARYWDLTTDDPPEIVTEFYRKAWPAAIEDKGESGSTFTIKQFPGAEPGEYIQISVKKGMIHISECLKKGKHKGS
jgi:hypothetical protein